MDAETPPSPRVKKPQKKSSEQSWYERQKKQKLADYHAYQPTQAQHNEVMVLAYLRTPPPIIARMMNTSTLAITKRHANDLKFGPDIIAAKLGMKAVAAALNGDKSSLALIARAQGVGKPEIDQPPPEPNGKPKDPLDISKFSNEDLGKLLKELEP